MRRRRALLAASLPALLALLPLADARAGYDDPAWVEHDADNIARTTGRQLDQLTDPAFLAAFAPAAAESQLGNIGDQVTYLPEGRLFLGLGQLLPGGMVGDAPGAPPAPKVVRFESRTGALLEGRLFTDGQPGRHPAVVITPGSIQGPQSGYWWAARLLAANGYVVFTFDTQGQGESEALGHPDPLAGFPSQQEANFVDGTVDALIWFLGPENPLADVVDRDRIGLAGHSLGARAVSVVAQCSDVSDRWREVAACPGPLPIRAVVGWDGLGAGGDVVPVVPGMDQRADGYFLNPAPTPEPPAPRGNLDTFDAYVAAGLDSYSLTVRGGTHLEWSFIPFLLPATSYGIDTAAYYTLAWFDRYLHPDPARRRIGADALLSGPVPDRATGGADELPWRANFLSARSASAFHLHAFGEVHDAADLRAYGGVSPVGDWPGANADHPAPRPLTP